MIMSLLWNRRCMQNLDRFVEKDLQFHLMLAEVSENTPGADYYSAAQNDGKVF